MVFRPVEIVKSKCKKLQCKKELVKFLADHFESFVLFPKYWNICKPVDLSCEKEVILNFSCMQKETCTSTNWSMVSPILTSQNFDKEFVLQIYPSDVFLETFHYFHPVHWLRKYLQSLQCMHFFLKFPGMVNGQIWSLLWHGWKEEDLKKMQALSSSKKFRKLIFKGTIWRVLRGQCLHLFQNESGFSMMGLF